jgi:hypothetical protein
MAKPTTRTEFSDWCLRKLGAPVITINIAPEQLEDRIDEAIQVYQEYHNDATARDFYVHRITSTNLTNKYITLSDEILDVIRVYTLGSQSLSGGMFNFQYQFFLNDVYKPGGVGLGGNLQHLVTTMTYLDLVDHLFNFEKSVQFNRHLSKLYINADWPALNVDDYVVAECRRIFDVEANTKVWNDQWLKRYAIALIKIQWGENLKKFKPIQLVNQVELNGQVIFDEGMREKELLEEEIKNAWADPPHFFVG